MIILSFGNLTMPLNGDQLAHTQQSKLHSITLIDFYQTKPIFSIILASNTSFMLLIYS